MKIVVLDGYTENPGDLSWDGFRQFGEVIVYDRTPKELILSRMGQRLSLLIRLSSQERSLRQARHFVL